MTSRLRLSLASEPDGTGELRAEVNTNGFSGTGSAWFNVAQIAAFARDLVSTYPLGASEVYELKGGIWSMSDPSELAQVTLGIRFYPVGLLGKVGCYVQLASDPETAESSPRCTVTAELETTYEELRTFARSLLGATQGTGNKAGLAASGA